MSSDKHHEDLAFRACRDRLLVKEVKVVQTKSGIYLPPDMNNDNRMGRRGVVYSVGPGTRNANGSYNTLPYEVGDIVYFLFEIIPLELDGQEFLVLENNQIYGHVKELDAADIYLSMEEDEDEDESEATE